VGYGSALGEKGLITMTMPSVSMTTASITAANQTVYLNGQWMPIEQAYVPVLDRGFIFGDAIYEVVPIYAGKPFRWAHHLARLSRSLKKIGIPNPHSDKEWSEMVLKLQSLHPWKDQFIYIQVTRGVAKRDHAFPIGATPTVFAMASEFVHVPFDKRAQGVPAMTLLDERWLKCDIKSTSLLGNVLAKQAAVDAGAYECVMFRNGFLTEGSAANVWVVRGGKLLCPPRDNLILEGIRVALIEELCALAGLVLEIRNITREEVLDADELLMSSATKEVLAITSLDGTKVGAGIPGPTYHALYAAYQTAKLND
jgi:D-alanine transaminase